MLGLTEADGLMLGLREGETDGLTLELILGLREGETDGLREDDGLMLGEILGLSTALLIDGETDGLIEGETD